ncbi:hypothetical protein GOC06_26350 [Sinorhizobium meliloti]|uniref:hypothetical protein n=1 Tax=Rhizobium meliloti TaxID=382 RepID=UPI00299EC970|nr:hypothetical protein [Sinorhizobium meliloti]MDX0196928.1 hypothetical protein [Sinorhizobium meliloti]MDX0258367.1 hypothetical protein [Sinorhizobium meliloti]MDX0269882.1 hypothetical protein [Sinorhizobium meliloti]
MVEKARVSVRVDKYMDGDHVRFGVPVRFRPVIAGGGKQLRRFDRSREIVTAIAPVSPREFDGASVELAFGEYDVEAVLPSGEPLSEELTVGPQAEQYGDAGMPVVLRGEGSPNEWRSWAHFSGATLASARQYASELSRGRIYPTTSFDVTIGSIAHSTDTAGFDPSSWDGWFNYFEERYRRSREHAPDIQLVGRDDGLSVRTEGGHDGAPLRIMLTRDYLPEVEFDTTEIGARRTYAAITGHTGTRLFALPLPWGDGYYSVPFEMLAFEDDSQLRCDPVLRDERWSGLVAYLNRGRVDLANEILKSARDALFEKFENPLAAALGGYVLLSSQQQRDRKDSWPQWLDNLARRFPYLPDGPILRARWLLSQNSEEHLDEAHHLLYDSVERGLPFFTTGVVWLIEGLQQTSIGCPICTEALRKVRGVARAMDLSQAFTSFSIAKPQIREAEKTSRELDTPPGTALQEPHVQEAMRQLEWRQTQQLIPQSQYLTERRD